MDVLRDLANLIYGWLVDVSAEPGFWGGFLIGFAALAIGMFFVFRIQIWWGDVTAPFRPQTVTHTTSNTPAGVVGSSCITFVLGLLVMLCIISIVVGILFPGTWQWVLETLGL
jgi:hypothetical protein